MTKTIDASLKNKPQWRDYYSLCKPNVVFLMLLTSLVGMCMATSGWVPWPILLYGNLGIGLCAACGAVVNHIVDQRIDTVMARTQHRPLPQGRMDNRRASVFALLLGGGGLLLLITQVNALTAWLTLASLVGYAAVYTLYLKRATPQNIVIGGLAGAMPPLLGWAAVSNTINEHALLLVLIIFVWTPPHFWALAIHRRNDYAKANIPMLPVTHGVRYTAMHTLLYTLLLFAVTLLPFATGMSGLLYLVVAIILNVIFMYLAVQIVRGKRKAPMATFDYSIVYLLLLFIAMLVDHYS